MVAGADILCQQSVSVQHLCVPKVGSLPIDKDFFDVSNPTQSPIFGEVRASESVSTEIASSESVVGSTNFQSTSIESSRSKFVPRIRSGSHTDIGPRRSNEDEHICIDDLSAQLGSLNRWPLPAAFYAIFDGHGGSEASTYVKNNALRLFFEEADLPETCESDDVLLQELEFSHRKSFLVADRALADECSVDDSCGTTALTALVLGQYLMIANAGDCRAVLSRNGVAVQISHDHRPTYLPEKRRVEDLGGFIEYGYLNGELAVTRALGDWYMKKLPFGSESPLTAEPDVQQTTLTEDDEFLIIGCDGIWDVMSNQEAVSIVRRELRQHEDPWICARELVNRALHLDATDNLTVIVVCFGSSDGRDSICSSLKRPRLRLCSLSEEARNKLRSLLGDN